MKAKNQTEKFVCNASKKLPPLTQSQREWGETHIQAPTAFVNKRHAWCSECGMPLDHKKLNSNLIIDVLEDEVVCPHCGTKLKIEKNSLGAVQIIKNYYTIVTTYQGYQVFRHFLATKHCQRNDVALYSFNEVVQIWIDENGKETIMARNVSPINMYYDVWILDKEMSIKRRYGSYYGYCRYDINPQSIYPHRRYINNLKRNGFKGDFMDLCPSEVAKNILGNSDYESLLKTNQIDLFKHLTRLGAKEIPYKYAVNICNRNNYIISDASLWYDLLKALKYLGKDLHSPHFICPDDLKESHDYFVELQNKKEEKIRLKRERELQIQRELQEKRTASEWNDKYIKMKEKYFDLLFEDDNLTIQTLKSVDEFVDEGIAMCHCVFSNGYYKESNSLILSAKDKSGERVETIEINLEKFIIIQSRGIHNSQTKYHDEIINLVNENMHQIRQRACA